VRSVRNGDGDPSQALDGETQRREDRQSDADEGVSHRYDRPRSLIPGQSGSDSKPFGYRLAGETPFGCRPAGETPFGYRPASYPESPGRSAGSARPESPIARTRDSNEVTF